jgi:hypothetical protein
MTDNTKTRRALLASAPAVAAAVLAGTTVALAIPRTGDVDPIIAAIAEHQAAAGEYRRAVMVSGAMRPGGPNKDPGFDAASAATNDASDREQEALYDVLTTQPTTLAGVVALLAHVGLPEWVTEDDDLEVETFLSMCANALDDELKQAARDFPAHLAETMRGIIERGLA